MYFLKEECIYIYKEVYILKGIYIYIYISLYLKKVYI